MGHPGKRRDDPVVTNGIDGDEGPLRRILIFLGPIAPGYFDLLVEWSWVISM